MNSDLGIVIIAQRQRLALGYLLLGNSSYLGDNSDLGIVIIAQRSHH